MQDRLDTCLVLEGAQGVKKSSLIAALVPERAWFAEDLAGALSNKDALQGLSGKWLVELSELAATRKSTVEEVKSFLTRRVDNYRAPYDRRVADHPRQCVFFGSVNPAADGSWLFDATGGRRFWPVHVVRADVAKVEQMRDQLWAEAVHAYRRRQQHWLTDDEEALATQEQKQLFEAFIQLIAGAIDAKSPYTVGPAKLSQPHKHWVCAVSPTAPSPENQFTSH